LIYNRHRVTIWTHFARSGKVLPNPDMV
jgi:hypothetical protein